MNRSMRRLHRIMGVAVAGFLLMFAATGVMLNHSAQFKLDQHFISADWLMDHYGIGKVQADIAFIVGSNHNVISKFGSQLFFDAQPLTHIDRSLVGVIQLENLIVLATEQSLVLLTPAGEFVEEIGAEVGIPEPIKAIGTFHGKPVIQTRSGMWRSDFMLDTWDPVTLKGVSWSESQPMPDNVADELNNFFYEKGVSVEQLLIDIHNGRILGPTGVWLIDIVGILLLILSFTGLWVWSRRL